jgi:hypothetical protein
VTRLESLCVKTCEEMQLSVKHVDAQLFGCESVKFVHSTISVSHMLGIVVLYAGMLQEAKISFPVMLVY